MVRSVEKECQSSNLFDFVDHEPRSRRPINFQTSAENNGSNVSSEGIGSQTSLEDNSNNNTLSQVPTRVPPSYTSSVVNFSTPSDKLMTNSNNFKQTRSNNISDKASHKDSKRNINISDSINSTTNGLKCNNISNVSQISYRNNINSSEEPHFYKSSETNISRDLKHVPIVISGKCSPASVSSKDSGCSASSENHAATAVVSTVPTAGVNQVSRVNTQLTSTPVSHVKHSTRENCNNYDGKGGPSVNMTRSTDDNAAGFSTHKRRSRFEEAIKELELVYNNIADDEDLLDRAERRDLPTAHQLLIWKDRDSDTPTSHNTSADSQMSDFDNFLNWNTSSSFEHISGLVSPIKRSRTPSSRRAGVSDKVSDDMMVRRMSAANKTPTTMGSMSELGQQSYLSMSTVMSPGVNNVNNVNGDEEWDPDEPDIQADDVLNRNIRDANQIKVIEPQPKFGVPLGPISGGSGSDYLHAVPDGKYRSTFNSMRNPDLVKDDLAFR